jgi:hypothetical protein
VKYLREQGEIYALEFVKLWIFIDISRALLPIRQQCGVRRKVQQRLIRYPARQAGLFGVFVLPRRFRLFFDQNPLGFF